MIGAQAALNFVLQVLAEEAAAEHGGPALFHAAHGHADEVEWKHAARTGAIRVAAHLVEDGEADLRQLRRTLDGCRAGQRTFEQRPPKLLEEFGEVHHSNPNSLAASINSRATGAATRPP